jgi:hypothetical protein
MAAHGVCIIGSLFEAVFAVVGLVAEVVLGVVAWMLRPVIRAIRASLGTDRRSVPAEVKPRELPRDVMEGIPAALQAEKEPKAALPSGWRGSYAAISCDSERIGAVMIGTEVRLIPEPDDAVREDSVRAEVDLPDRITVQVGHLRRGHELSRSIAQGRVHCWFASRRRTLGAEGWEAVLFVAVYDP